MMMESGKKWAGRTVRKGEVFYKSFSLGTQRSSALVAASARNCACTDGVLAQNFGVEKYTYEGWTLPIPTGVAVQFFTAIVSNNLGVNRERFGYITYDNLAYVYDEDSKVFVQIGTLQGGGVCVSAMEKDGKSTAFFVCGDGVYRLQGTLLSRCTSIECLPVACFCGGRIFTATKEYWLVYSAAYEPTAYGDDLADSGKIALRNDCGKIVGLVPLKNRLCVLYERGISMVDWAGSARSFVRKDVVYNGENIYGGTACVSNVGGEKVYFFARDGVYRFDGVSVERTAKNLQINAVENRPFSCAVSAGKYLLSYTEQNGDWKSVSVDLESGEGCAIFPLKGLCASKDGAIFAYRDVLYRVVKNKSLPVGETSAFVAPDTDFSMHGRKTLQGFYISGVGMVTLGVTVDGKKKERVIVLQEGGAYVRLGLRGKTFSWSFHFASGAKIFRMTAVLQTLA